MGPGDDARLSEPQARFRTAFEDLPLGLALVTADGRVLAANEAFYEQVGDPAEANWLALVDDLTGLHNRRSFLLLAEQAVKEATRARRPVIVLFLDVDGLKAINDTRGHAEGDRALRLVADALRAACREADIIGRLSGDEFAILLAEAHELDGLEGRVRRRVAEAARTTSYPLSVSIGVARSEAGGTCTLADLFEQADRAMYVEKDTKRGGPPDAAG